MNISLLLKRLAVMVAVLSIAVGCASTPEPEETAPAQEAEPVAETQAEAPAPAEETAPAAEETSSEVTSYTVESGDNLWNISAKADIYDNPFQWPLIFKANRDQIKDADLIHPGQDLSISRGMSDAEIDAAIAHAKNRGAWSLGTAEDSDQVYLSE